MIRNEKGFLYPLTLCFLLLFSTALLISTEYYLTIKKMKAETENILKMDYCLLRTVQLLEASFSTEESVEPSGTIIVADVQADYTIAEMTESLWDVTIIWKKEDYILFKAHAYYDRDIQQIYKWVEL